MAMTNLADLQRPPRIHRIAWYILIGVASVSLIFAGWTAYENDRLVHTNALLVRMLDEKLDSIAMSRVLAMTKNLDARLVEALRTGGARAVNAELRKVE